MTGTMTLTQVEELVAELPVSDQQRLIERMTQRLTARQGHMTRAKAFLKSCLENPVRPAAEMGSGEEIASIREERGDYLS